MSNQIAEQSGSGDAVHHPRSNTLKDGSLIKSVIVTGLTAENAGDAPKKAKWFHWHEPGTSKEEKRLILKLDWFLLSISCLTFFIKQVINCRLIQSWKMSDETC